MVRIVYILQFSAAPFYLPSLAASSSTMTSVMMRMKMHSPPCQLEECFSTCFTCFEGGRRREGDVAAVWAVWAHASQHHHSICRGMLRRPSTGAWEVLRQPLRLTTACTACQAARAGVRTRTFEVVARSRLCVTSTSSSKSSSRRACRSTSSPMASAMCCEQGWPNPCFY